MSGLAIERAGTEEAYFTQNGDPLLSFGGLSDFLFYGSQNAYDYERWADWAAEHGMNHTRSYPPLSFRHIEAFEERNNGDPNAALFPYSQVEDRTFDLTSFDSTYWDRFRRKCKYLEKQGIVIHLLMVNGWQLQRTRETNEIDWVGHFFNPENNINSFTDHLAEDRYEFYYSVAQERDDLVSAQKAWFEKLVQETADLNNVYYDLVHELTNGWIDNKPEAWEWIQLWIDEMAATVRETWDGVAPEKQCILGMDTGGMNREQREWVFKRPNFDLAIWGKVHTPAQARRWRQEFEKPYIPQECWDDDGTKYGLTEPGQATHIRKFYWKFMMAKCQQMDLYTKSRGLQGNPPAHVPDPDGINAFQEAAPILREFWESLVDYPNLWFDGYIRQGPGSHKFVLSSEQEAVSYCSSPTGHTDVKFDSSRLALEGLATTDGQYDADIVDPTEGIVSTREVEVKDDHASIDLPGFIDDIAVHLR